MKIWIDDIRTAPDGYFWCRSVNKAMSNLTRENGGTISCGCKKSKGEAKIIDILIKMQVPFISQKKFPNCIYPKTNC